jgi:poly(hydroxyalkanoate) depolymerase family esterase
MKNGFGRSLSKALKTQKKFRKLLEKAFRGSSAKRKRTRPSTRKTPSVLRQTSAFGTNPGGLIMKSFVPERREHVPALVVLLHGCRQTPESLDAASGFSKLARERGFILLYPEQTKANNAQGCFNWFRPSAVAYDRGELMSIRQMIEYVCVRHRIDRSRIFIAGLSAGGAMTSALVANYPESFAGVAIIAGLPFGAARDAMSALRVMRSGASAPRGGWGRRVRENVARLPRVALSDDLAGSAGQGGQSRQRKCMHCAMARSAWDPRRSRAIRGEIMGRPAVLEASRASPRGALFSRGLGSRHSDKQSGRHRAETLARPLRATGRNLRAKSVDATVGAAQAPGPPDGRAVRASIGSRSLTLGFRPPFQRSG